MIGTPYKYHLTQELANGLTKLDDWLSTQPWDKNAPLEFETLHELRDIIIDISNRGYYTTKERILLNALRRTYHDDRFAYEIINALKK